MKSYKKLFFITLFLLPILCYAGELKKQTYVYAKRGDADVLKMDVYSMSSPEKQPCIIFVFGGGFKEGTRDAEKYQDFFEYFADKGFVVASIDYRLGMKGEKAPTIFNQKPMVKSIEWAVEDLYDATKYILQNSEELNVKSEQIIISGSSAGAVTVLQADYDKRNRLKASDMLPSEFQYAGVISFSGSIYSTQGAPKYEIAPAPTLLFHGDADKLVPYNSIRFFRVGMFGSKTIAKQFKKNNYPYLFYSMEGIGHEVAEYPMVDFLPEVYQFLKDYIFDHKQLQIDVNYKDMNRTPKMVDSPKDYYSE